MSPVENLQGSVQASLSCGTDPVRFLNPGECIHIVSSIVNVKKMQRFRYLDILNSMNCMDSFSFKTSFSRWSPEYPAPWSWIFHLQKPLKVIHTLLDISPP